MVGLLILSKFKTKVFSFYFFSSISVTIIFTESITKPKVLILCVGTIWDFLKFMTKSNLSYKRIAFCMFSSHIEKVSPLVKKSSIQPLQGTFSKCKVVIGTLFNLVNFLGQDPRPFGKHVKQYNSSFYLNLRNF